MRAGLRAGFLWAAAGLGLVAAPALAQTVPQAAPQPTTNTPATESVGPRDLQNFSLGGTVTRRADPVAPAQSAPATSTPARRSDTPAATSGAPARTATPSQSVRPSTTDRTATDSSSAIASRAEARRDPAAETGAANQPAAPAVSTTVVPSPPPAFEPVADPSATGMASEPKLALWPWLLAAVALAAGGIFLFRRNHRQEAFAGGPQDHAFAAPEPAPRPMPRPTPAPAPVAQPAPSPSPTIPGTITTRLRPAIEIGLSPLRFIVEEARIALELEIELFNSGNAPARAVLIEATLLNAGNEQDDQLRGFFANPVGDGQRIAAIPPLQRIVIKTQVAVAREHIQQFEIAGKKVCVPLLALNALYGWGRNEGQTSAAYLIGRETEAGKLAPFRLDLGPRLVRGVGLRELPNNLRK